MAEVLEHLIEDAAALLEVRRVLHASGILVLSVPFFHDRAEYHVRIHSPRSIRRLLDCVGFKTVSYVERGGLITFARTLHGLRQLLRGVINEAQFNRAVVGADLFLNQHFRWLLRRSRYYGCYLSARKIAAHDPRALNVYEFRH